MDTFTSNEKCNFSNRNFPIDIHRSEHETLGVVIPQHWHENFEILYFESGSAVIYCNSTPIKVTAGDLIIVNSNDVHSCENTSSKLVYYVIEFDLSFIYSKESDLCQTKYMIPLLQNRILFKNQVDSHSVLLVEIRKLIAEYYNEEIGFELLVKAYIYQILVLLLRHYNKQTISEFEKERHRKTLNLLMPVLSYMDCHYTDKLNLKQLAAMANMSTCYFCRIFKSFTGKAPIEYITGLRLNKAIALLKENNLNITEIALQSGFTDSNYFSRQFKKYKTISPSLLQKNNLQHGNFSQNQLVNFQKQE